MAHGRKLEKNRGWYMFGSFIVLCAIVYIVFNIIDGWGKYQESMKRLEASNSTLQDLQDQYSELEFVKQRDQTSTGREIQIRSKFDMSKPEENTVFIVSEEIPESVEQEKGFKKMLNTFKNFFN